MQLFQLEQILQLLKMAQQHQLPLQPLPLHQLRKHQSLKHQHLLQHLLPLPHHLLLQHLLPEQ
jgi:hypothetical protein